MAELREPENMEEKYRGKENTQYENEVGTIIKQIVCANKDFAGLMLERVGSKEKINEFVYDCNPPKNENKHYLFRAEYQNLQSEIEDNCNLTQDEKIKGKARLLRCFFTAYNDNYKKNSSVYLADIYASIDSIKTQSIVEMFKTYILIFIFSVILVILLSGLDSLHASFYQAGLLGELGAFVMLCFSYDKIRVVNRESNEQLKWRYGAKLICGCVFGYIMLLFLRANLILPEIADNDYVRMICSFFAGFNSKWIPRLGSSITGQSNEE